MLPENVFKSLGMSNQKTGRSYCKVPQFTFIIFSTPYNSQFERAQFVGEQG